MTKNVFALMVCRECSTLEPLKSALRNQSIETWSVATFEEASRLMEQTQPELIFADPRLGDGTWLDIINMIERASTPINLIVVGTAERINLRLSPMEDGAFDFIQPPFETESLGHVLQHAVQNVRHRRAAQALRTEA